MTTTTNPTTTNVTITSDDHNLTSHTVLPSGRQQSIKSILKSFSSASRSSTSVPATRRFLEDLALRGRNRFQSQRRVFSDMSDGVALLLMSLQMIVWAILTIISATHYNDPNALHKSIWQLVKYGPIFITTSLSLAFFSSLFLYFFTKITIHFVSLSVLGFILYTALFNLPHGTFTLGNFASLLTFLFLALYYRRGLRHLPLTCKFIQSASRICWRNHVSVLFVFASYALFIYGYLLLWSASILFIQSTFIFNKYFKTAILAYSLFSLMFFACFLRDLLQIWLSRIIYTSTFAYPSRPVTVTSLKRKPSIIIDNPIPSPSESSESIDDAISYEETQRIVSRESMWWCMGTAARSAFHLVLRAFQIHIWFLSLVQIFYPSFGPPADPKCVLDVFHVPTAIYGTSYNKSRRFIADTMVDHGMDQISVDLYFRTFIYYMISYACEVFALISIGYLLGDSYKFKISFLIDSCWSILTKSSPVHFASIFVAFSVILYYTAIDSVHMILCWSICETPTSVSALEPELMGLLVTSYHARLDLRRFAGDRIHTSQSTEIKTM